MQAFIDSFSSVTTALSRRSAVVPVLLRVVLGFVMASHGWQKVERGSEGVDGLSAFLDAEGVLFPGLVANVVPWLEFLGGIALILGLLTRVMSLALATELLLAAAIITAGNGLIGPRGGGVGYERDLVFAAGLLTLVIIGPGRLSIDRILGIEPDVESDTAGDSTRVAAAAR